MRKLALRLDQLRVATFATDDVPVHKPGTVRAHAEEGPPTSVTCAPAVTCWNTCQCPSWSGPECVNGCVG